MARVPSNFKAQLITTGADGKAIKRNFGKIRHDITDDELINLAKNIRYVLVQDENLKSMNLTANSGLNLQ